MELQGLHDNKKSFYLTRGLVMVKKALIVGCLGAGFAVMVFASIVTQPRMDEQEVAPLTAQVDTNELTLKARNLPIQTFDAI